MDSERCYFSSSISSSSSSSSDSSSTSSAAAAAAGADRLELEAAEALADLAHLAMRESGSGDSAGGGSSKWGSKGKRGTKRVKSESPPVDPFSKPDFDSGPISPDLSSDQQIKPELEQGLDIPKPDLDVPKSSPVSVKSYQSNGGSRTRQNLTEAEKEERRLRRILANRESARQTIRRRQALCEELTRKAADLAWENENLKREKESVLKEFQSLESKNKYLKAQMAKLIKTEVEESPADFKPVPVEKPTNPTTNCQLLLYNQHPFSQLCWPSIIQSPNPVQSHNGSQSAIIIPANISIPSNGNPDSTQQQHEHPVIVNGPRAPLYIVSCPWFFPLSDHRNGVQPQPSFGLNHTQDGTTVNNQCSSTSSSNAPALLENLPSPLSEKVKAEATSSAEVRVINDLNETPIGFPPDGGGQCTGLYPSETVLAPVTISCITPTVSVKNETRPQSEFVPHTDNSRQLISGKNLDPFKFPSKKVVDAAAAAEARRRRKELTKIKNVHSRMNC